MVFLSCPLFPLKNKQTKKTFHFSIPWGFSEDLGSITDKVFKADEHVRGEGLEEQERRGRKGEGMVGTLLPQGRSMLINVEAGS